MRISNIIKRLQHIQDKEGDLTVYKTDYGDPRLLSGATVMIDGNVKVCVLS